MQLGCKPRVLNLYPTGNCLTLILCQGQQLRKLSQQEPRLNRHVCHGSRACAHTVYAPHRGLPGDGLQVSTPSAQHPVMPVHVQLSAQAFERKAVDEGGSHLQVWYNRITSVGQCLGQLEGCQLDYHRKVAR